MVLKGIWRLASNDIEEFIYLNRLDGEFEYRDEKYSWNLVSGELWVDRKLKEYNEEKKVYWVSNKNDLDTFNEIFDWYIEHLINENVPAGLMVEDIDIKQMWYSEFGQPMGIRLRLVWNDKPDKDGHTIRMLDRKIPFEDIIEWYIKDLIDLLDKDFEEEGIVWEEG